MGLHESDTDIEAKFAELRTLETVLDIDIRQIRQFQKNLNSLTMVSSHQSQEVTINKTTTTKMVTVYSLPPDFTGNKMTEETRKSQKIDLFENIDEFLDSI